MNKFYISYCYPYGEVITNGNVYICEFDRYYFDGIKIQFTEHLDDAGFYCSLDLNVLLRYLNIRFKDGVPNNLITTEKNSKDWW